MCRRRGWRGASRPPSGCCRCSRATGSESWSSAGEAYPLVPLTTDLDAVAAFLSGIYPGMVARPGSDLERAVAAALELLPPEGEGRVVVLVTDGENLQGNVDAAVSAIKDAGVGALTVVAGTERGGPIPVAGPDGAVHHKRDQNGQPVITRAHPEVLAAIADAVDGDSVELADRDVVESTGDRSSRGSGPGRPRPIGRCRRWSSSRSFS